MGRASFFEYMTGDFENHLQVPADFIENFNWKTPQRCTIRSAFGKCESGEWEWVVEMVSVTDKSLFFGKGWKLFVKDNFVEKGNFLVFKYCGGFAFYVNIYGKNRCEIVPVQKKARYDTRGVGKNKNNFKRESLVYHEESSDDDSQTFKKAAAAKYSAGGNITKELLDLNKPVEDVIWEFTGKNINTSSQRPYQSSRRANEAAVEGNNGAERAQENPPSFKLVMTSSSLPSCKGPSLHVPAEFRNSYFAEKTRDFMVLLTVDGSLNQWPAKYLADTHRLSSGWPVFSRDNHLALDDECVFEVVNDVPITFNVTIRRKKV